MAQDFVEAFSVPFPVFTDPEREAYRLSGLRRGVGLGLKTMGRARRAAKSGQRQGALAGDPWQQGGVLILTPEPRLAWHFVSSGAGDHARVEEILNQLDAL